MVLPAYVKYEIIHETISHDDNCLSIAKLCRLAEVSRSGYYSWVGNAGKRAEREEKDRKEFDKILAAYKYRGYAKGALMINMRLLHMGILMNVKKIRRLMKKYGLRCPVRKANPYRRMAKALKTDKVFPNIVDRKFTSQGARKVLLTDITYLSYQGGMCYLSTILDAYTREILAYKVSSSLAVSFVLDTIDTLIAQHECTLEDTTIIHSDQGCHYTSKAFISKLRDAEFVQSMSRKGNCWDNAPQESFFGHMKDEIRAELTGCASFDDVSKLIDDWIDYYNTDRYQWELCKLSPHEYYIYITTGDYPTGMYRGSAPNPEV